MSERMEFPNTFDDFTKEYGFKDKDMVYSNGIDLMPVFRVKQYLDDSGNVAEVVHSKWIQVGNTQQHYCEACGVTFNLYAYCKNDYKHCPYCGAVMDSKELTK